MAEQQGEIFFLTKITVLTFLAVQMVSIVVVGLHFDNLPRSI
jgi:hypothetical protein